MSTLPLDIPRQAKSLIETGKTSAELDAFLDIKPGTLHEWKGRYMWDGPEGLDRPCNDDLDNDPAPAEYERIMSLVVMDTLDWIRRIPRPYRRDAILKRERALELLSKRAEQVIGSMAAFRLTKPFAVFAQPTLSWSSSPLCDWMSLRCQKHRLPPLPPLKRFHA